MAVLVGSQGVVCAAPSDNAIVRIHWLGKKKISADTNSAGLMGVWQMPESVRLEAQTLDKLSSAPWRLLRGQTNMASTNPLRPLLNDVVEQECYLEIRRLADSANAPEEMILAVRLDNSRAGLWQTNIATALESLTGIKPVSVGHGWSLKKHHVPNLIELVRVGEWTVLGAAEDHNALLEEALARIKHEHAPFAAPATNAWLDAEIDLPKLAGIMGVASNCAAKLPNVSLAALGRAGFVHTTAEMDFAKARFAEPDRWHIPTNLIDGNLNGFTAVRGLRPWLATAGIWSNFLAGPPPDQFCLWTMPSVQAETYFATPLPNASNAVSRLSDFVLQEGGPWLRTNTIISFQKSTNFNGLIWHGFPYVWPFLESTDMVDGSFAFGGSFIELPVAQPMPAELLKEIQNRPDIVYFEWERTGPRVPHCNFLLQNARYLTGKPQLASHSASLDWLLALESRLGVSTTEITRISPRQLSFKRGSTIGLTAIELNLMGDWLESPEFPLGLYTFLAPPPEDAPPLPWKH